MASKLYINWQQIFNVRTRVIWDFLLNDVELTITN